MRVYKISEAKNVMYLKTASCHKDAVYRFRNSMIEYWN